MNEDCLYSRGTIYQIQVKGILDQNRSNWFDGFTITPNADGITCLIGSVRDQAALHGLLAKIRDLGLILISVNAIETEEKKHQHQNWKIT